MVIILVGGQWGDEGKGKVIDLLADGVDMVVRSQGGNNAGHTVVSEGREFRFQLIPSGILYPRVTCVIGHGMVVDPGAFLAELDTLRAQGISTDNLVISDRAHMVMPYHPAFDKLGEQQRGDDRLGTTARGIGPTYEDKVRRIGFRIGDLQKPKFMEKKLRFVLRLALTMACMIFSCEASAWVNSATNSPSFMTQMRSASPSSSGISEEMSTIARPSSASRAIRE